MSLRVKFLILIAGSILTPSVVMFLSFGLTGDFPSLEELSAQIELYRHWRTDPAAMVLDEENPGVTFRDWPTSAEIQVYGRTGDLVYTQGRSSPGATPGLRMVQTSEVTFVSGARGTVVVTRPADFLRDNQKRFYVPLAGLVFFAAMAVVIGQSMTHSISMLEKATSRIASGDLDFELPHRGNDKLASLTRSFESMRQHLKEEYARRSRFMLGISHDLKTPLSSISGYVAAIRDGYADTPEKLDRYTAIIGRKAGLLESRLSMLIDYVKRDTSEWAYTLRPVDLARFIRDFARVFEMEASLKGRRLTSTVNVPDGFIVSMDDDMVLRAFENLAHNALVYSPAGTPLDLRAVADTGEVRIAFANEGPGIAPGDLESIFEPFSRGTRDRSGTGMGLGLATVKSVIANHGWRIEVSSTPQTRTVFTVRIPCVPR